MKHMETWLAGALGSACALLCRALGGWDAALHLMFLLMGMDLLTGCLLSLTGNSKKTSGGGFLSGAFFLGVSRKLMMVALVMLATALDALLGDSGVSRLAVIGFYAAGEGMSILENAALLGLPLPKRLTAMLEVMRDQNDK